jgi:hemin uptake protein HemP
MDQSPRITRAIQPETVNDKTKPSVVDSATLLDGRPELIIRHGEDFYRLRLTASNKLILTK